MKIKVLAGLMVGIGMNVVLCSVSSASITGSMHDFSGQAWNASGEVCNVCHTPHNAGSGSVPLWGRTLTTTNFTLYTSTSLNATIGQPSASSKACLSCHDGTVALDSFGGNAGSTALTGKANLGADLSNDHPVSFTYDASLASTDGGLHDPTIQTVAALGGKTVDAGMLNGHKLECSSCHDVHNDKGDASSTSHLLLVKNSNSALCLTCHNK